MDEIAAGRLVTSGEPEIVSDRGACVIWNGRNLSGIWLTSKAFALALERAGTYGVVSIAISHCHHIGCLAAYLPRVTERGCVALIYSSGPGVASVAPFGGTKGVFSPSPIAAGIPTSSGPVLIDTSASITTNNLLRQLSPGQRLPHPWLMDHAGTLTDDPAVMQQGGTILLAGGLDHGQKGYGWALLAEALSQGLSGFGRADAANGMLNAVFIQAIDPDAFSGKAAFERQTTFLADACRASTPRPGFPPVRIPGDSAFRR
jgi:L-lactate dehydrogenase